MNRDEKLTQDVFKDQPKDVDWAGVDYDGRLVFGKAISPHFKMLNGRWRGIEEKSFKLDTEFERATEIRRK